MGQVYQANPVLPMKCIISEIYEILRERYGPRGWWPLLSMADQPGFDARGYHPGRFGEPRTAAHRIDRARADPLPVARRRCRSLVGWSDCAVNFSAVS